MPTNIERYTCGLIDILKISVFLRLQLLHNLSVLLDSKSCTMFLSVPDKGFLNLRAEARSEKINVKKKGVYQGRSKMTWKSNLIIPTCGNCSSSRIRDLNTSKAKLQGAKYQREKIKTGSFA